MEKRETSDPHRSKRIKGSEQTRTILFTDIEDSTGLWGRLGDIDGRLMVDRHNRLLFPVIKRFRGRLVKTIGDSIMAEFKVPGDAVKAGIAMQQILQHEREQHSDFTLRVRIGIHTGRVLAEVDDIFGDAVNVAARVEQQAAGDEILLSGVTANKLERGHYQLVERGEFVPKGKRKKIKLFSCQWDQTKTLIAKLDNTHLLTLFHKQKLEVAATTVAALVLLGFLYHAYFRFLIADHEEASLWLVDPLLLPSLNPYLFMGLLGGLYLLGRAIYRMKTLPLRLFRVLSGIAFATLWLLLFNGAVYLADWQQASWWNDPLYESTHLFVEVMVDEASLYGEPTIEAEVVAERNRGDLLLQNDFRRIKGVGWNRAMVGPGEFGWIERVAPARIGVPEQRMSYTGKFYFRYHDLYGLLLMVPFFVWGFLRFQLKPI